MIGMVRLFIQGIIAGCGVEEFLGYVTVKDTLRMIRIIDDFRNLRKAFHKIDKRYDMVCKPSQAGQRCFCNNNSPFSVLNASESMIISFGIVLCIMLTASSVFSGIHDGHRVK